MHRDDLLKDHRNNIQDPDTIFVCTWHPSIRSLPRILSQNYHLIENDVNLIKKIPSKPIVAFRRKKHLSNFFVKNDIKPKKKITKTPTLPCEKCKISKYINTENQITNSRTGITSPVVAGTCKSPGVIYVARCKKHNLLYVGHTGETLATRFAKHLYDIKNRPKNSELAEHFHSGHNMAEDLDVTIVQKDLSNTSEREHMENRWMCRLQTRHGTGLNIDWWPVPVRERGM